MPDFATALKARLQADTEVAVQVASRVYWGIAPQGAALPYLRLNTISDPRPEHLKGYEETRAPRVQVDCFAASYGVARNLAEDVIAAVALPVTVGGVRFGRVKAEGPRDLGEEISGTYVYRASVDLLVEHTLA